MNIIKLRNGTEEAEPLVKSVMMHLTSLWDSGLPGVLMLYDLREICEGRGNNVAKDTIRSLKERKLVEDDGRVHASIRNVVLSALEGQGLDTTLVSPLATPSAPSAT